MASPYGQAVELALGYLRQELDRGVRTDNGRLPSLGSMAVSAGVSRNSMWKAVGVLREKGLLTTVEGGRITITAHDRSEPGRRESHLKQWERTASALGFDIVNGRLGRGGILPSRRELQSIYGVCYETLRKSLSAMERNGIIVAFKRSYRIPTSQKRRFQSTIVVLAGSPRLGSFDVMVERGQELASTLENDCARSGRRVRYVGIDVLNHDIAMQTIRSMSGDESIIGYIFNLWWLDNKDWQQVAVDVVNRLTTHKKPVAVLDHVSEFPYDRVRLSGLLRVFRPSNRSAGTGAASLLLKNQHSHLAYLSIWHHKAWSIERLAGAEQAVRMFGAPAHLSSFNAEAPNQDDSLLLGALGLSHHEFAKIFKPGGAAGEYEAMLRAYRRHPNTSSLETKVVGNFAERRDDVRALRSFPATLSSKGFALARRALYNDLGFAAIETYSDALYEKALADRKITAWICSSDDTAIKALDFARRRGLSVPGDLSIVGFDNKMGSFEQKLTSYDFNIRSIAVRMMGFVLRPERWPDNGGRTVVEVEGTLIERETTGVPS